MGIVLEAFAVRIKELREDQEAGGQILSLRPSIKAVSMCLDTALFYDFSTLLVP